MLLYAQLNNWHGIISCSLYGLASWHKQYSCLTVPPRLSHAPFHGMHVKWLKMSFSIDSKIIFVVTQIQEILTVLVLWCNIIRKIDDLNLGCNLASRWKLFQKGSLKRWTATVLWWRQSERFAVIRKICSNFLIFKVALWDAYSYTMMPALLPWMKGDAKVLAIFLQKI